MVHFFVNLYRVYKSRILKNFQQILNIDFKYNKILDTFYYPLMNTENRLEFYRHESRAKNIRVYFFYA